MILSAGYTFTYRYCVLVLGYIVQIACKYSKKNRRRRGRSSVYMAPHIRAPPRRERSRPRSDPSAMSGQRSRRRPDIAPTVVSAPPCQLMSAAVFPRPAQNTIPSAALPACRERLINVDLMLGRCPRRRRSIKPALGVVFAGISAVQPLLLQLPESLRTACNESALDRCGQWIARVVPRGESTFFKTWRC